MTARSYTVLLTCVGGVYARDTIEALRLDVEQQLRIVGTDAAGDVANRYAVDAFYQVPSAAADPNGFLDVVTGTCRRERVDLVLPCADDEVTVLAGARDRLEAAGIRCAVQDVRTLETVRDKLRLFDYLCAAGIPVPRYAAVRSANNLVSVASSLGYPRTPFVLKPSVSRGARGVTIVDPGVSALRALPGSRGHRTGPVGAVAKALTEEGVTVPLMAMELLSGAAYDVDCLADRGRAYCTVVRRRLWRDPLSPVSQGCRIEAHPEIEALVAQIALALGLDGAVDMDFGSAPNGTAGLFEVNPRWSGSVASSLAGGVNVPALLVRQLRGLPLLNTSVTPGSSMFPVTRMTFVTEADPIGSLVDEA